MSEKKRKAGRVVRNKKKSEEGRWNEREEEKGRKGGKE